MMWAFINFGQQIHKVLKYYEGKKQTFLFDVALTITLVSLYEILRLNYKPQSIISRYDIYRTRISCILG